VGDKPHIFDVTVTKIAQAKVEAALLDEPSDFNLESDQIKHTRPDQWSRVTAKTKAYAHALKQFCKEASMKQLESMSSFPDNYKNETLTDTPYLPGIGRFVSLKEVDDKINNGLAEEVKKNIREFFESRNFQPVFSQNLRVMSMLGTITFNLTIVSCELDMIGYVLGSFAYYEESVIMGKILICAMPVAYIACILIRLSGIISRGAFAGIESDVLSWYHVVPMTRYVLFFKPGGAGENDVLQLFRVNTLSSFTLGIAMLVCTVLHYAGGGNTNVYTAVSLTSQATSWLVTILYFTPVAKFMKVLTQVDQDIRVTTAQGREVLDREQTSPQEGEKWKDDMYNKIASLLNVPRVQIIDLLPRYSDYSNFSYMHNCALISRAEYKINVMLGKRNS
jgi:hypothetical protein